MNNDFNCYYNFNNDSYIPVGKTGSNQSGSLNDSLICSIQINALSNMQAIDNGYKANQSTEESSNVVECINPNYGLILDLAKAIIERNGHEAISIIENISQPILQHEKVYLVALAQYNGLSCVENILLKVFKYSPLVIASSRRRVDAL